MPSARAKSARPSAKHHVGRHQHAAPAVAVDELATGPGPSAATATARSRRCRRDTGRTGRAHARSVPQDRRQVIARRPGEGLGRAEGGDDGGFDAACGHAGSTSHTTPFTRLAVLKLAAHRHNIARSLDQALPGQVARPGSRRASASRLRAAVRRSQREHPRRHRFLVADVAGQQRRPSPRPRSSRSRVSIATVTSLSGALRAIAAAAKGSISAATTAPRRLSRGDRDDARAGTQIEHLTTGDGLGMVEQIARERLTAGPGEGPERGGVPKRARLSSVACQIG